MDTAIKPEVLTGNHVTLTPMTLDDAPELLAAAESIATFRYFTFPPNPWNDDGMRAYCARLIDDPTILPHTVRDAAGMVVGSTTYCSIRPLHRGVEIGWTWYAPSARGTTVNPECKMLLLTRAFETDLFSTGDSQTGSANRVELKTDERNAASRAAILKLGASLEGILRHHVIMPDGHLRNSAMHSILASEWPAIKHGLKQRIARRASR